MVTKPFSGPGNQYIFSTTPYGDGFVTVGEDFQDDQHVTGRVWMSGDGSAWSTVSSDAFANAEVDLVATSGASLVAIGRARQGASSGPWPTLVWVSEDGDVWNRLGADDHPLTDADVIGVTSTTTGYVAWGLRGDRPVIALSPDGRTWTEASIGREFDHAVVQNVQPVAGGFAAIGYRLPVDGGTTKPPTYTNAAWWSPEGRAWTAADVEPGYGLGGLFTGTDGLLAVGGHSCGGCISPATLWRSSDGRSWTAAGSDVQGFPLYASDGTRIVRYEWQSSHEIFESLDGFTWRRIGALNPMSVYGFTIGAHGFLISDSIPRNGPDDEVDGGVRFVAVR
jgi:hypothetical protein